MTTINKISDETVEKATGKNWREWVSLLDKAGCQRMPHKEIAQMLYKEKYIKSGWWCQMVTVGYEYAKGRRVTGQTLATGFEVGIQRTYPLGKENLWKILTSGKGLALWLGSDTKIDLKEGGTFKTKEGISGEFRVVRKGEKLRLTWKLPDWKSFSTLQIYLLPVGANKTSLRFHQEKLPDEITRKRMRDYWQKKLELFTQVLAK